MFIISLYDYNDVSGERFYYEEYENIKDALISYNIWDKSLKNIDRSYIMLLYTESGNIIYGF